MSAPTITASVNSGPPQSGDVAVAAADSVQLGVTSSVGGTAWRFAVSTYPDGWPTPSGWSLDGTSGEIFWEGASPVPPPIVMPTALQTVFNGLWGSFPVYVQRNGDPAQRDASMIIDLGSPSGFADLPFGEYDQRSALKKWTRGQQQNLRTIERYLPQVQRFAGTVLSVTSSTLMNAVYMLDATSHVQTIDVTGGTFVEGMRITAKDSGDSALAHAITMSGGIFEWPFGAPNFDDFIFDIPGAAYTWQYDGVRALFQLVSKYEPAHEVTTIDLTSAGASHTETALNSIHRVLKYTNATVDHTVTIPDSQRYREHVFVNAGAHNLLVKGTSGATTTIAAGKTQFLNRIFNVMAPLAPVAP